MRRPVDRGTARQKLFYTVYVRTVYAEISATTVFNLCDLNVQHKFNMNDLDVGFYTIDVTKSSL